MPPANGLKTKIRNAPATRRLFERAFAGNNFWCPCCNRSFRRFHDFNGDNRVCWHCESVERHRMIALLLQTRPELLADSPRILHIAPEPAIVPVLRDAASEYVGGDLLGEFNGVKIDVTDLGYGDASFDAIICNHVLEHVPDDRRALSELRRVLRPGGWGIVLVPDLGDLDVTDEDASVTDPRERLARFGQVDHVRKYGWDYLDRLRDAGFGVTVEDPSKLFPKATIYRARLRKFDELEPLVLVR